MSYDSVISVLVTLMVLSGLVVTTLANWSEAPLSQIGVIFPIIGIVPYLGLFWGNSVTLSSNMALGVIAANLWYAAYCLMKGRITATIFGNLAQSFFALGYAVMVQPVP